MTSSNGFSIPSRSREFVPFLFLTLNLTLNPNLTLRWEGKIKIRIRIRMTIHDILETVRRVEIRTNRLVTDMMVGAYLSHFKGRGMDFEDLRDYMPGDDVRNIDWNVTYRM